MPPATVAATLSEMNAPAKLSTEAMAMAVLGERARVEIDEATTLAVSWKPLVKSNASAVATTITSSRVVCTGLWIPSWADERHVVADERYAAVTALWATARSISSRWAQRVRPVRRDQVPSWSSVQ